MRKKRICFITYSLVKRKILKITMQTALLYNIIQLQRGIKDANILLDELQCICITVYGRILM